jgi:hypothetical protein
MDSDGHDGGSERRQRGATAQFFRGPGDVISSHILEMITQRCHRLRLAPRARQLSVTGGPLAGCQPVPRRIERISSVMSGVEEMADGTAEV